MSNAIYPSNLKGLTWTVMKTPEFSTIVQQAGSGSTLRIAQRQNPLWHFTLVYDYLYDTLLSPNNTQANSPYTDLQTLMGFYSARQGQYDDFLFLDPSDFCALGLRASVWQANRSYLVEAVVIDALGNAQVVSTAGTSGATMPSFSAIAGGTTTDGTVVWSNFGYYPNGWPNAVVPLSVVTDANGNSYSPIQRNIGGLVYEDITDLIPGTLVVYANGAVQTQGVNFTIGGPGLAIPGASYGGLYLAWSVAPALPVLASFQFYFRVRFETDSQDFERTMQGLWTIGGSRSKNGSGYIKLVTARPPGV